MKRMMSIQRPIHLAVSVCLAFLSFPLAAAVYQYHPSTVVALGSTFDPVDLAAAHRQCIDFDYEFSLDAPRLTPIPPPPPATGGSYSGETVFSIVQLQSQRDLYSYLHISGSVSGHYALFSAGASFDLEDENKFHEDSFSWALKAETQYGRYAMYNPRLAGFAQDLARRDLEAFRAACGYEFVAQVNRSVLAAAVFTVHNLSSSQKHRMEASFNAAVGGGLWGVDAGVKYSEFLADAAKQGSIELSIYVVGGPGITQLADVALDKNTQDIAKLKEQLVQYMKKMGPAAGVPTQYVTGSLAAFVPTLATLDFDQYLRALSELYFVYKEVGGREHRIRQFILHSADFGLSDQEGAKWLAEIAKLDLLSESVVNTASNCRLYFSDLENEAVTSGDPKAARHTERRVLANRSRSLVMDRPAVQGAMLSTDAGTEVCRTPELSSLWNSPEPPQYPFTLEYELIRNQNAAGVKVVNLALRASGPKVAALFVYAADEKSLLGVFHASTGPLPRVATGSIDVTAIIGTTPWLRTEVITESGQHYSVLVPLI
jgi:hypothetical protein